MAVGAVYPGVALLVITTLVFVVGWSSKTIQSPEINNDASGGFFTYKGWVNSEKELDLYNNDVGLTYEDCLRVGFAGLWPALQHASGNKRLSMIGCRDKTRLITYEWRISRTPYPPRSLITALMNIPSFWRDHKEIYQRIVHQSYEFYNYKGRRTKEQVEEAVGDFSSYEKWIDSEKKIKFDDGRNMTYDKCVKMEFGNVWDMKDKAQRESKVKCDSMAREVSLSWARSNSTWPPLEFFGALMKVPSFWRNHTQIYEYLIKPAQYYNRPHGNLPLILAT